MSLTQEQQAYIQELENKLIEVTQSGQQQIPNAQMFNNGQKQNLVEWQLDFGEELGRIEHHLRCDIIVTDPSTKQRVWAKNPNSKFVVFNDQGVNDLVREITMFLNKNTVLSNYREDQIAERVRQFGHELRALIYNNYEEYGVDNEYKQNNYPIMVITILAMIESAYRRSINGEERRDLNSARIVQQNESPMMGNNPMINGVGINPRRGKSSHWYAPWTWGR